MEYSEDFRMIQTTMSHCNEFVKKFDQILYYGGNEVFVEEIAARLRNIFQSKSYNSESCDNLRKISFLLVLNTDASFSRDLNEDYSICHLLDNFPQLSKCLLANLIFKLKLEKYLYECLKFSPSWFMLQFLPEVVDSLRFSKPLEVIVQVKEIVESIYCNICRMDYKILNASQQVDQKRILGQLVELTMTLLSNYNTPNVDVGKSKKKMREYLGVSLNNQLKLIISCLNMFLAKPNFVVAREHQIYKLLSEKEPEVNNYSNSSYSPAIKDSLSQINVFLLNTLQNSVVTVTLDDFVYWVEIDIEDLEVEDEDLKRDNLQKSVGELSYSLIQLINNNESFEHSVVNQLDTISIKPESLAEIASKAIVGTLLDKIETSSSKRVWFDELLSRPDTLYFNTECLQTIIDNASIIQLKDLFRILKDHQNFGNMDNEDEQQIRQIFRVGSDQLNILELRNFTEELIRAFGDDYNLEDNIGSFSSRLTNYFNKLTEKCLNESEMWKLIVLNPSRFFESLLANVGNQDRNQIEIVLKILSETSSVAENFIMDNILRNLESSIESSKTLNHIFLAGLFKLSLVDRKTFIKDILMNNIANAMTNDKQQVLAMLLSALLEISGKLKMEDLLSPLVILLAQVLDKHRWDLMSFTSLKEKIVEKSIEIIQNIMKTLLVNAEKKDKGWIVSKVKDCKPMTKFYFQKLSLEKSEAIKEFDKFLNPKGFDGLPKSKIISFLCEIIVRCTSKEFKWLMKNQQLQSFITDALLVITVIAGKANQPGVANSFRKSVSDYVKVLKDLIIPSITSNEHKQEVFNSIVNLIKKFPSSSYDELTVLFIESMQTFKDCDNFKDNISELEDCEMKLILLGSLTS